MSNLATSLKSAAGTVTVTEDLNPWDLDYADGDYNSALNFDVSVVTAKSMVYQKSISGDTSNIEDLWIKSDGTKLYTIGDATDRVYQYDLSPAWRFENIQTPGVATYYQFAGTGQLNPKGLYFKPDGTKMYTVTTSNDRVNEYDLSTPWDVTSATHNDEFAVGSQEATPQAIFFKTDGTKMYIMGISGDDVNEYDLSTAWDITTATYSQNASVSGQETGPQGLWFSSDGSRMFVTGSAGSDVNGYTLSTPWDVSTLTFDGVGAIQASINPHGVFFKPDGTRFYIAKTSSPDSVREYYVSIRKLAVGTGLQETAPTGLAFKPDGTKMYICGTSGDDINEYDLSTAWDVDTATFTQNQSISGQETAPESMYFKSDGTALYVAGNSGNDINQYSLSTAWDVSTLSFVRNFSVNTQETSVRGVEFTPDGETMYICGTASQDVHEYNLTTAWDISTATLGQSLDVSTNTPVPHDLRFKDDGTKMFLVTYGSTFDGVTEYDLSLAWDISTATYSKRFHVPDNNPTALAWKPDGTKMYVLGQDDDTVYQYAVG